MVAAVAVAVAVSGRTAHMVGFLRHLDACWGVRGRWFASWVTCCRPGSRGRGVSVDTTAGPTDASRRDAVVEQLFLGAIGALETLHVYLGDRLGLYDALAEMP